jgi:hypothetical protein
MKKIFPTVALLAVLQAPIAFAQLEIRFYNSSTNKDSNVYILPNRSAGDFWWKNSSNRSTIRYSGYITNTNINPNTNATIRLSDLTIAGTNSQGKTYYSIYTTNWNSGIFMISYGGGHLTNGSPTPSASANSVKGSSWAFSQWGICELSLTGAIGDQGDVSCINNLSIPFLMRTLRSTNLASDTNYYEQCGWTNISDFQRVASNLMADFPQAIMKDSQTNKPVMVVAPASMTFGTVSIPGTTIKYPKFTKYFEAAKARINATNTAQKMTPWIKDYIGINSTGTNGYGKGTNYFFWYDFKASVGASNSLLMTGSISASAQTNPSQILYSASNLVISLAGDGYVTRSDVTNTATNGGVVTNTYTTNYTTNDWASSLIYTLGTPANYLISNNTVALTNVLAITNIPSINVGSNNWASFLKEVGWYPTNPTVTTADLWKSSFYTTIVGRIMGDMAAGFAMGFINSTVTNPAYGDIYGRSPSGSWWGGNEYPAAKANTLMFQDVQTNSIIAPYAPYSLYCADIYEGNSKIYFNAITDRMQSQRVSPDIATDTNTVAPGDGIKIVEIVMKDGISSLKIPQSRVPGNILGSGQVLTSNGVLASAYGSYTVLFKPDGTLVELDPLDNVIWSSVSGNIGRTNPPPPPNYSALAKGIKLAMQGDDNLVIYNSTNKATWATGTQKKGTSAFFRVMESGELVIYEGTKPLWSSWQGRWP